RMVSLAIHHGERPRVDVLFLIEARDELVERAKVGVMFRRFERINNDRMYLALSWSAGLFVRCAGRWLFAHRVLASKRSSDFNPARPFCGILFWRSDAICSRACVLWRPDCGDVFVDGSFQRGRVRRRRV